MSIPVTTPTLGAEAASFLSRRKQLLVNGRWTGRDRRDRLPVCDPSTGDEIDTLEAGDDEDADHAVAAARAALPQWRQTPPSARAELLARLAQLVERDRDLLCEIEALDSGRPVRLARSHDVGHAISWLRYGAAAALHGSGGGAPAHEPIGTVAQINPAGRPLLAAARAIAMALAAGCTTIVKPATATSLSTLRLGELLVEAQAPPGVVNILTGSGRCVGAALAAHAEVDLVIASGAASVARQVGAVRASMLRPVLLEPHRPSATILFADADVERALAAIAAAGFSGEGPASQAGSPILVHRSLYDEVLSRLSRLAEGSRMGPSLDPSTEVGALASRKQLDKILAYIDVARIDGAAVTSARLDGRSGGYFAPPTILASPRPDFRFPPADAVGPVIALRRFGEPDEAIAMVNEPPAPAHASLWTGSLATACAAVRALTARTIHLNGGNEGAADAVARIGRELMPAFASPKFVSAAG